MSSNSRRSLLQAQILLRLERGPVRTVSELALAVNAQRPSVSRSLKTLRSDNLVERRRNGWHLTSTGADEAKRCVQDLTRVAERFRRTFEPIASSELSVATKAITGSFGSDLTPAFTKILSDLSASLELKSASSAFSEILNSSVIAKTDFNIDQAHISGARDALSKVVPKPYSPAIGKTFTLSLAPLVESQSRLSEMIAQSIAVPELGFIMSKNNAMVASAIENFQALIAVPSIRSQGIDTLFYPEVLSDIRDINTSFRTLLGDTAGNSAAKKTTAEMEKAWSRMLRPSSTVTHYSHSLRSRVTEVSDESVRSLPPASSHEESQELIELQLTDLNPNLADKWKGSWQALEDTNPDRLSQAAHSFRELIRMLLNELAPDVELDTSNQESKRKTQARKILKGREGDFAGVMVDGLPRLYDFLCKAAHTSYRREVALRAALMAGDGLLLLLLSSKEDRDA